MAYFLSIGGKWFPLETFSAKTEDGGEVLAFDFDATLCTQGAEMSLAVEAALDEYAEEMAQGDDELEVVDTDAAELVEAINQLADSVLNPENWFAPFHDLSPAVLGHILLQFLGPNPDALSDRDRINAALMANILGPDWGQKLYHFAVKITKIAD